MDDILFDVLFIIGSFVCGVAIGYLFGLRDGSVEQNEKDESCITIIDR